MFFEREVVIDGTKYIRADLAVQYVREKEEKLGESIFKNPIEERYKMTEKEFNEVADLFETDIVDKKFIEIENATIHVLNKEQFRLMNKIINCYYDIAYARLEYAIEELED